ncbi:MAG: phage recombination protein Bet [Desulfobacterales bacterium]
MENQVMAQNQEKIVVEYEAGGQKVKLTPAIIRKYLVTGRGDLVTDQELVFFMHICRARGLNPFNRDCYLIKYTQNDPAAIIVSIDKIRQRARLSADCVGWKSGVICRKADGSLRYSNGLVMEDETVIGGWFEAKPKGWEEPFRLEVNLNGYIRKTKDGAVTRFWAPENQPTMIAKVAEAQGLRRLWPEQIQGLYLREEVEAGVSEEPPIDISPTNEDSEEKEPAKLDEVRLVNVASHVWMEDFIEKTAEVNHSTIDEVIRAANANPNDFMAAFWRYVEKRQAQSQEKKQTPPADPPADPQDPPRRRGRRTREKREGAAAAFLRSPDIKLIHPVGGLAGQSTTGPAPPAQDPPADATAPEEIPEPEDDPAQFGEPRDESQPVAGGQESLFDERTELEALRAQIRAEFDAAPGAVLQAQRNLNFAVGRHALPSSIDGCRVLIEEIERVKKARARR